MKNVKETAIATRVKTKGDTWVLVHEQENIEHKSLTDVLEAYVMRTTYSGSFRLDPRDGKIYTLVIEEEIIPPTRKFDLYGEK